MSLVSYNYHTWGQLTIVFWSSYNIGKEKHKKERYGLWCRYGRAGIIFSQYWTFMYQKIVKKGKKVVQDAKIKAEKLLEDVEKMMTQIKAK